MDANTCPTCGARLEAGHDLCPACLLQRGLDETPRCASCGDALAADARFCAYCGTPVPVPASAEGDPLREPLQAKLAGHYRVIRLLGRGGMGAVYLARDLALDREVAIKVVHAVATNRDAYERFRREARTAAKLSHPNIVPLHAFGEVEGMPYFVMGYVRGESLASRLRREGKLPEEETRRVIAEIADALDHAHRQGVIHRDIKPDNVLLDDESGRAMLTDFGVAKALGSGETMTARGNVVGTPHYMSPEQAAGRADVDARTDLYSLGVMAYAMLAGRLPFDGKTPGDVLTKHLTQEPPPLRPLAPALSESTVQIVERCLAKDPSKRWPDARSLKAALGAADRDDDLPDAVSAVHGQGAAGVAVALLLLSLINVLGAPSYALVLNAGVVLSAYVLVLFGLRLEGVSLAQANRALWAEPAWWTFWYPRRFRRRGNVWDRLPAPVKQLRWWIPVLCLYIATWVIRPDAWIGTKVVVFGLLIAAEIVLELRAKRFLKRRGVTGIEAKQLMLSMPLSRTSFWNRPHVAAILAPSPAPARAPESPHSQLHSILRDANDLSGALRPLGAQAALAARQLLASIDEADREIADVARSLEPGEEQRLADKIALLAEAPDTAPMRALLEKQLELIRGLAVRIDAARARRERHVELLRNLALQVASLRARSSDAPTEVMSLSDRVRTLCADIESQQA